MIDILYFITFIILLFFSIRLMVTEWGIPMNNNIHPEMEDIDPDEELMIVRFNKKEEKEKDPLYASLQNRINEIIEEYEDEDDDEEDDDDKEDDDGDMVVRR